MRLQPSRRTARRPRGGSLVRSSGHQQGDCTSRAGGRVLAQRQVRPVQFGHSVRSGAESAQRSFDQRQGLSAQ